MNTAVEDKIFDVTLSDDQRMNREAVQRFAAAEIRVASKDADEAGATPESFYTKTLDPGPRPNPNAYSRGPGRRWRQSITHFERTQCRRLVRPKYSRLINTP